MLSATVLQMAEINFQGNIIPHAWYQHPLLKTEGKHPKTHGNAIQILAEIVYWYRPIIVKDEATGKVIGYRQKFKRHKLQKSYPQLATCFGLSAKQARDAVVFLKDRGLITTEVHKTFKLNDGTVLGNVMFIEPVTDMIKEITFPESVKVTLPPYDLEVIGSAPEVIASAPQVTPSIPTSHTLTETTNGDFSEKTTSKKKRSSDAARADVGKKSSGQNDTNDDSDNGSSGGSAPPSTVPVKPTGGPPPAPPPPAAASAAAMTELARAVAREVVAEQHEKTVRWLETSGLPKVARVAQREAYDVLKKYGLVRRENGAGVGRAVPERRDEPQRLDAAGVEEMAEVCCSIFLAQGQEIEATIAFMSSDVGGPLMAEDVERVREAAHAKMANQEVRSVQQPIHTT